MIKACLCTQTILLAAEKISRGSPKSDTSEAEQNIDYEHCHSKVNYLALVACYMFLLLCEVNHCHMRVVILEGSEWFITIICSSFDRSGSVVVTYTLDFQRSGGDKPQSEITILAQTEILTVISRNEFGSYNVDTSSITFDG